MVIQIKEYGEYTKRRDCRRVINQTPEKLSFPLLAYELSANDESNRYKWLLENATGIEYAPDPSKLGDIHLQINSFIEAGIPVRFHTRYPAWEIGNADHSKAEEALEKHLCTIDFIHKLGEPVLTVHIGLNPFIELDFLIAETNLSRLVEYAERKGIKVCVENLRRGASSNPENILTWAEASGAGITLDVGHAVSCDLVRQGVYNVNEIAEMFAPKLEEVHIYAKEDESRHHPVKDIYPLAPVINCLLEKKVPWWTVELKDVGEAQSTRNILKDYIYSRAHN